MAGEHFETSESEGRLDEFQEKIRDDAIKDLNDLRRELAENPGQDSISVVFDLGEYKKDENLKNLISDKESAVLMVSASVDTAVHRQKSDKLPEYVKNAKKIEKYSKYFDPQTNSFYEKNRAAITEIASLNLEEKDLKNSPEWEAILEKYGSAITDADGALNFILAFMRATDEAIFSKIDKNEIGPSFNINLTLKKGKGDISRRAIFELKLPKGAEFVSNEVDLNLGLLNEVETDSTFWTRHKPNRYSLLFQGDNSKFGKMYKDLMKFKKNNPSTFSYYEKYETSLRIIAKHMSTYYTTFGAVLPDAEARVKEYADILKESKTLPSDKFAIWRSPDMSNWLSSTSFVSDLNQSSIEPLLGQKGLLRILYAKVFKEGKVSANNKQLFEQLTKILIEYENYHTTNISDQKIEQLKFNLQNASFE